jgi:hypothetical protein
MTYKQFITTYKADIDQLIKRAVGDPTFKITNEERRLWILNDEGLYNFARSCGVRI